MKKTENIYKINDGNYFYTKEQIKDFYCFDHNCCVVKITNSHKIVDHLDNEYDLNNVYIPVCSIPYSNLTAIGDKLTVEEYFFSCSLRMKLAKTKFNINGHLIKSGMIETY